MCDVDGRWHGEEVWDSQRSGCSNMFWQRRERAFSLPSSDDAPRRWILRNRWSGLWLKKNAEPTEVQHCQDSSWRFKHADPPHPSQKKKTSLLNSRPLVFPAERFSQSVGVTDYFQHVDVYFTFNLTYRKKSIYTCSLKHLHQHILSQPSE